MRDNCVIFTTPERQELRVVFDPDGTPFFCGPDLAAIAGYEQPRKAVTGGNKGVNRIDSVLRKVPWDNGMRKGRCEFTCFSAENAVKLLCRRPAPYAAIRWLEDEVIPKTQEMGEEVARAYPGWNKPPQQKETQPFLLPSKGEDAVKNFDRQYRLSAGKAGSTGFEIGGGKRPLHVSFSVEKADTNSQNTAKVTIWNLSDEHLAELSKNDCVVVLHAGYGNTRPLIFTGVVTFATTKADGADRSTEIELVDNRIEVRDTYVSVSYAGAVNCKTLIQDTADQMGVTVSFSYNAEFKDIPNGYSYVGPARNVLTKACETSGLTWSINNGVLQVKKPGDTMSREVYELSAETGLLGLPERVQISNEDKGYSYGWDVEYLMNAAIGLGDYVYLNSKMVKGYFRVYSVRIEGDNMEGSWSCTARLLEVKQK